MTPAQLYVAAKSVVADGVVELTLKHSAGHRLTDWAPGAHIDLFLPNGLCRQYSLCGDRWDAYSYRVGVLREPRGRGGSAYIHDELAVGAAIAVGGPRNNFNLVPSPQYLFIAGGIGITPLLPMLDHCERLSADWQLLYGGRSRRSMAFVDELHSYAERVTLAPQEECGLLDLPAWLGNVTPDTMVYCCGPGPLLDAVQAQCSRWPPGRLRTERFAPGDRSRPIRDTEFGVVLRRSGRSITVAPGQSVLQGVRDAGVAVLSSCQQGTCGTCETSVLEGQPDHRDSILDDAERNVGDRMFICVSRSSSDRLVLDL